jgi:hypothetical protein
MVPDWDRRYIEPRIKGSTYKGNLNWSWKGKPGGLNWPETVCKFVKRINSIEPQAVMQSSDEFSIHRRQLGQSPTINTATMSTQAGYSGGQQAAKQARARARVVPDEVVRERQSHACEWVSA